MPFPNFRCLCILAAILSTSALAEEKSPDHIVFSRFEVGVWKGEATTDADLGGDLPLVHRVGCMLTTNGMILNLDRDANLVELLLHGELAATENAKRGLDQDRQVFGFNITAVKIGSNEYDAKPSSPRGTGNRHFSDIQYPPENDDIIGGYSGYLLVRDRRGGPWLRTEAMLGNILHAPSVEIRFRDDNGHSRTFDVRLDGLGQALERCERETASPAAMRFHQ